MSEPKQEDKKKLAAYSTIGLMFPASIAVGLGMGYFLDKLFHTTPVLLIVFTLYGTAAGFWNLYKITAQHGKQDKKNKTR